ncbi:MAG: hypothetical protein AB7O96_16130 [Pseudobdellovibrionaceae bacterium]
MLHVLLRSMQTGSKYEYDPRFVNGYLKDENPTQASVLLIHEWLWDFYEDDRFGAPKIRDANAFLHSADAEMATPKEFQNRAFKNGIIPRH